jgi:hypothetical protein
MRVSDIRDIRVLGVAVVDVVAALALAFVLAKSTRLSLGTSVVVVFASGVALHTVFGVDTAIQRALKRTIVAALGPLSGRGAPRAPSI